MANPATIPTPVKDVQGDGRWMSMVSIPGGRAVPPMAPPSVYLGVPAAVSPRLCICSPGDTPEVK